MLIWFDPPYSVLIGKLTSSVGLKLLSEVGLLCARSTDRIANLSWYLPCVSKSIPWAAAIHLILRKIRCPLLAFSTKALRKLPYR